MALYVLVQFLPELYLIIQMHKFGIYEFEGSKMLLNSFKNVGVKYQERGES